MQNFFQKIPFIRITSLFLAGILFSHYFSVDFHWIAGLITVLISCLLFLWYSVDYRKMQIQNLILTFIIFCSGVFYPQINNSKYEPVFNRKDYFLAEVCQKPSEKAKTFQTILLIQNKTLAKPEKVTAYFSKENFDLSITTGDQLVILATPQEIRNAGNPFEIDYQSIMHQRGIWFSVYLPEGTYLKTGNHSSRFNYLAEQMRDKLIAMLTKAIPEREERSVVSALTLGYRSEIDQNTLDYFASTGAMHVLSVSGLHVALIYFILGFLLSFLKRGKAGSVVFYIVMISFLWIYAFITGFSPAVQRATVMFSFVIIGDSIRRPVNIYNSLTASALFLMLLNPDVIFDIGFQLSYLAIFGIVLIQPVINNLFEVTNPILKWTWSLLTVSVAAQITTFPLSIFYFNQFPNLFWLSSFVVIPVTTFIIWLTLAFFILSPLHAFSMILGELIQLVTHFMLVSLKWMDALPFAVWKGIVVTPVQVWLLFGCISAVILFVYSKKTVWLFTTLLLFSFFQIIGLQGKKQLLNQYVVLVYNSKNPMIHLIDNRINYLITNESKNLSESEKTTVERVCYHLKLDKTQVISIDSVKFAAYMDLVIKDNQIQFANSRLKFSSSKKYDHLPDQLELTIFPRNQNSKSVEKIIYLGNIGLNETQDAKFFRIKQEGAFYANLNVE